MTIYISAFPGVGKSVLAESLKEQGYSVADCDSSHHDAAGFPYNYAAHLLAHKVKGTKLVFMSSHEEIRKLMTHLGQKFVLVFPENTEEAKANYLKRYTERGSSPELIRSLMDNWDAYLTSCNNDVHAIRIELLPTHTMLHAMDAIRAYYLIQQPE